MNMKVTYLRRRGSKEFATGVEIADVATGIINGVAEKSVLEVREVYHLIKAKRLDDGQISTNWKEWHGGVTLPRVCFAAEWRNYKGQREMVRYNGLVTIEVNGLPTYEKAVEVRELVKKMPETLLAFLGASGKSVKIVCRGELFGGGLPKEESDIQRFHRNLYETARRVYQNQFGLDIEYLEPRLDRTVYLSADAEAGFNPEARQFYADTEQHADVQAVAIRDADDRLMPGRTFTRSYQLNWTFIMDQVLGHYFELGRRS